MRTDCFLSVEKIQERLQHCGLFLLPQLETARGEGGAGCGGGGALAHSHHHAQGQADSEDHPAAAVLCCVCWWRGDPRLSSGHDD